MKRERKRLREPARGGSRKDSGTFTGTFRFTGTLKINLDGIVGLIINFNELILKNGNRRFVL